MWIEAWSIRGPRIWGLGWHGCGWGFNSQVLWWSAPNNFPPCSDEGTPRQTNLERALIPSSWFLPLSLQSLMQCFASADRQWRVSQVFASHYFNRAHKHLASRLYFASLFWNRISYGPGWPQTYDVVMENFGFLLIFLLSLKCWDSRYVPLHLFMKYCGWNPGFHAC